MKKSEKTGSTPLLLGDNRVKDELIKNSKKVPSGEKAKANLNQDLNQDIKKIESNNTNETESNNTNETIFEEYSLNKDIDNLNLNENLNKDIDNLDLNGKDYHSGMITLNEYYSADDITELKFPDTVREKVGMYLGDGGQKGFFHTFTEIKDNSVDEFVAGYGSKIDIKFDSVNHKVSIRDYGRGIPFEKNKHDVPAVVLAMTTLHAGGKHRKTDGKSSYKYSSGINGVGASVVNGCSKYFLVRSIRDNEIATVIWENGHLKQELIIEPNTNKEPNGTFVEWIPSVKKDEFDHYNVFESDCLFVKEDVIEKLQYDPYLNLGLEINLEFDGENIHFTKQENIQDILKFGDQKLVVENTPAFKEELVLLLDKNSGNKKVLTMDEYLEISDIDKNKYEIKTSLIEFTFNFCTNQNPIVLNFANGVKISGGKPDIALKNQFKTIFNEYLLNQNKKLSFEQEDLFSNFTYMLAVKINEPSFAGQTKDKLNNPESSILTTTFMKKYLNHWINRLTKHEFEFILKIVETAKKAREESNKITVNAYKNLNSLQDNELLARKGKLEDCTSKDPTKNEIYIIEGDSAAGGIRSTRVSKYQAFIPLKGKPLNVIKKANQAKILANDEISALVYALGGLGEDFDIEKLKYHKIIILADADLDGFHIAALMLTFFYHFYPEIIKRGYLYVALAPLYKISYSRSVEWAWDEKQLKDMTANKNGYNVTRNKGLGEMDPIDLFNTTLNPLNRKFIQIQMEDIEKAKAGIDTFMSDEKDGKDILKSIIKEHYHENKDKKRIISLSFPEDVA